MKIEIKKNLFTLLDDEDLPIFKKYTWYFDGNYVGRMEGKKKLYFHREILGFPSSIVDHINQDKLDNRKSNLRLCTKAQNIRNSKKSSFSKFKGVYYYKNAKKWGAYITFNYKQIYLGLFTSAEAAAKAYDKKAKELFGEFASPNFNYE